MGSLLESTDTVLDLESLLEDLVTCEREDPSCDREAEWAFVCPGENCSVQLSLLCTHHKQETESKITLARLIDLITVKCRTCGTDIIQAPNERLWRKI